MPEVAGDEDLAEDLFGFCGVHAGWCERKLFGWKAEDIDGEDAEFLPYGLHPEALELFLEQGSVDLGMVLMEIHRPVAELAESDSAGGHVADRMVQDEEGVECGWSKLYGSSAVVPCAQAGSAGILVEACDGPCLKVAVHADPGHVVRLLVELDLDSFEMQLYMVVAFRACLLAGHSADDLPGFMEVVHADVKVDVSAASAFRTPVILCHALPFQQDRRYAVAVQLSDNILHNPVLQPVHLDILRAVHHQSVQHFLRWPQLCRQRLYAVAYDSLYSLLPRDLQYHLPVHTAPEKTLVSLFSPKSCSQELYELLLVSCHFRQIIFKYNHKCNKTSDFAVQCMQTIL